MKCPWDAKWCGGDCADCSGPQYKMKIRVTADCQECSWIGIRTIWVRRMKLLNARKKYEGFVLAKECPKCNSKAEIFTVDYIKGVK